MRQPDELEFATARLSTGPGLRYAEGGDSRGESIVFLHAYVDSWFTFSRVLPLLSPVPRLRARPARSRGV